MLRTVSLLIVLLSFIHSLSGQGLMMATRVANDVINFDGEVGEMEWSGVPTIDLMMQVPQFGIETSEASEIKLAYDDEYLYLSGSMHLSDPSFYRATTFKRDAFDGTTDYLGMVIDSYNDYENAMAFFTTPTGLRWDGTVSNDALTDDNISLDWNTFWDSKAQKTEDGWSAEMRIPWKTLRFQDDKGTVIMGITIWWYIAAKNEVGIFPLIPLNWGGESQWKPSQTQRFQFEGVYSKKPVYLTPYVLGGYQKLAELNHDESDYIIDTEPKIEAGLDVKYSLTSNMTLDITANTDFAQVEADDQQVNLTRFNLFFPEKRQFFLERSSTFDFNFEDNNRLFYSRRIGIFDQDPVRIFGGARLQGRIHDHDLGFMTMQTESPNDTTGSENFSVIRVRRQAFNKFSYLGFIGTNRMDLDGSFNATYGFDGIIRLFGDEYLDVKWAQSFEDQKSNEVFSLDPARIFLKWERRRYDGFSYIFNYSRTGRDWNPGIGFEARETFNSYGARFDYGRLPSNESSLLRWRYAQLHNVLINYASGKTEYMEFANSIDGETRKGWTFFGGLKLVREYLPEILELGDIEVPIGRYDYWDIKITGGTPFGALFGVSAETILGSFYDGRRINFSLSPRYKVSPHVNIEGYYEFNDIDFTSRKDHFVSHVARIKLEYLYNTMWSLTAFVQYNSFDEIFTPNVRFRFNPEEGHDLYIVFNDLINTNLERQIPHLPRSEQQALLVKYTYTFKL